MTTRSIPSFSLERQTKKLRSHLIKAVSEVIDCQQFIGGQFVKEFEQKCANFLKAEHVIGCNSGTDALWMALHVLGTPKNSIVLTTPFSFIASASEIIKHEAHSVFIDINSKTFNICPKNLESWLKNNATTKEGKSFHKKTGQPIVGIVTVDLFGQLADYEKIQSIAHEWKLWIVEDACQAIGADYKGQKAGTFGDISAFSFYPTKNLSALGDGGACVTNNPELADKLLFLRNIGRKTGYNYTGLGVNSRLDGVQAAILNVKLNFIDEWNSRRREIADYYNKELANIHFIQTPTAEIGTHVYHQYSIQVVDEAGSNYRDQLANYLNQNGIGTRIYYDQAFTQIDFLNRDKQLKQDCPVAEQLTQTILSLPIWPEMTDEEVEYVVYHVQSMPSSNQSKTLSKSTQCIY